MWKVSLQGPITSGSEIAKSPSAARTSAISVVEVVNWPSSGGRYAAVVVSENASPKAPRPSVQTTTAVAGLRPALLLRPE